MFDAGIGIWLHFLQLSSGRTERPLEDKSLQASPYGGLLPTSSIQQVLP